MSEALRGIAGDLRTDAVLQRLVVARRGLAGAAAVTRAGDEAE